MQTIFAPGLLDSEVAIITGGGTGIGRAIAREMGMLGSQLVLAGRRLEPLLDAKAELESQGVSVWVRPTDIRKVDEVEALVQGALEHFGKITILVNNAGGQFPSPAQHISPKGFEAVVRNNLLGTWNMIWSVANRAMIPARRGRIINITAQVERGFPGMAHTGAARAGVQNLTRTLAVEWACHGIRINCVAPGVIRSSGIEQYPPELIEASRRAIPLKRLGTPEEVSHLVVYLSSRAADYITGQTFIIDGGQALWSSPWEIPDEVLP
ncbi:MAG: SDR family oxidoreductase [Sandaracinaceae bacterium]|nr:SDR family oxidoreductase [Sandaracinaceae bacterium]